MQLATEVNEAIAEIGRKFEVGDTGLDFFCECGAEGCLERLSLTIRAFDRLRSTAEALLADGHPLVRAAEARARARRLAQTR
ncbi:MAG: hypothetical protein ACTHKS_15210 [Gaiellaceae bacterium]